MTTMTGFILAATLLVLVILAILLPPLWRTAKPTSAIDRREANLGLFRDQLSELEHDYREGSLTEADFAQAKIELQRRLLDEVQPQTVPPLTKSGRKTALALLIALPLAASVGYLILGNPQAFDPLQTQSRVSPQQIEEMLSKLVEKLNNNPDDTKGWVMLARSYRALGRYAEAVEAYSHGSTLLDLDAVLLTEYADVLGQINGGRLEGKPSELIDRALKLNPEEPQALFLAGVAAKNRNDYAAVADYWGRLLLQLEPGSQDAKALGAAVDKAHEILGQTAKKISHRTSSY